MNPESGVMKNYSTFLGLECSRTGEHFPADQSPRNQRQGQQRVQPLRSQEMKPLSHARSGGSN